MHLKKNSWLKHWDFIFCDLLCLNLAFLLAYWLRLGFGNMYAIKGYRMMIILVMMLHFCIAFFTNCYSGILRRGYLDELKKVIIYNIELICCLFAYMFTTQLGNDYSRTILIGFFFLNITAMYLTHISIKKIHQRKETNNKNKTKLLIVASEKNIGQVIDKINNGPDKSYDIVGISLREERTDVMQVSGVPVVSKGKDVYRYACSNVVDSVLICFDNQNQKEVERITDKFLQMGATVHIAINSFEDGLPNVYLGHINEVNVMTTSVKTITSSQLFLKRTLDICAGVVGCLITGLLFIFVAPAIKIADPKGSIFFCQKRVGKNGRIFRIYKFRSMYSDAEERKKAYMADNKMNGLMFKMDKDPRIIGSGPDGNRKGVGYFLRTTSIDEFPNFWNILKGDMSLVGTRPPTTDEYEKYELHHKSRLAIKPGLTGIWQVSGRSGMTDFEEIVKLENEYIKNWSVSLDIKIILKTAWILLKRENAQ